MSLIALFATAVLLLPQESERETFEVWLCPLHRDEQSTEPGKCPIGGRDMVLRELTSSYSCPMHTHIDREEPGICSICYMNLVPMTREMQWFCPDDPRDVSSEPGAVCAQSGKPMELRTIPLAHGDHNPKHGGILFMAPDRYHHLEGVLSPDGEFRLYFYDDFTEPIGASDFPARIETESLTATSDGAYAEARFPAPASYPAEFVLHVRFPGDEEESRFDFIFVEDMGGPTAELRDFDIPDDPEVMYAEIFRRDEYLQKLLSRGAWQDIHVPALQAKDLMLALIEADADLWERPGKKIVKAAWLLDIFGDEGNRPRVEAAYVLFQSALEDLEAAHAE